MYSEELTYHLSVERWMRGGGGGGGLCVSKKSILLCTVISKN